MQSQASGSTTYDFFFVLENITQQDHIEVPFKTFTDVCVHHGCSALFLDNPDILFLLLQEDIEVKMTTLSTKEIASILIKFLAF